MNERYANFSFPSSSSVVPDQSQLLVRCDGVNPSQWDIWKKVQT